MSEFIQGIKNLIGIVIIGVLIFVVFIQWNALNSTFDLLSANSTWSSFGDMAGNDPTGEAIAVSFKYILLVVIVGGLIVMAVFVSKRKAR